MIWRTQMNAFTHCFIKNLQKATKVGAPSWKFVHSPTLYLVRWVSEKHTCKDECNSLLFMLCHLMVYDTLQDTIFLSHLVKNKVITNPNLSKFYGRQRDWKKLHPDFARILILVNQPGLNKLSFKMTRLNGLIIYQFFRAVHTESE